MAGGRRRQVGGTRQAAVQAGRRCNRQNQAVQQAACVRQAGMRQAARRRAGGAQAAGSSSGSRQQQAAVNPWQAVMAGGACPRQYSSAAGSVAAGRQVNPCSGRQCGGRTRCGAVQVGGGRWQVQQRKCRQ